MLTFLRILLLSSAIASARAEIIFGYGSEWKYLPGLAEASSPDLAQWRTGSFDDSQWPSGHTPIGYANPPNNSSEENIATLIPSTQEAGYLSVFFRRAFTIVNPAQVHALSLNINVDDGYIAWLNGSEIGRFNVPSGDLAFNSTASSAIEATMNQIDLATGVSQLLVPGTNVVSVQVFNANATSSDLLFDASLADDSDETAPIVADITPTPQSTVSELTSIEVIFSEPVTNVDAADLLIDGVPVVTVAQISPLDYTFGFPQPSQGTVTIAWATNHGIADLASIPNSFAGGQWTYTLNSNIPPAAVLISEFMADNAHGIKDADGSRSDWIELFNSGNSSALLAGWFLTDSTNNPTKWRIPAVRIDAKSYLLLWASGKDRTNTAAPLHTNFKLDKDGSYLALLDPNTNAVSEFAPAFPPQRPDVSYGRDIVDPSITGYFVLPTPGNKNSSSGPGFAPEPIFSQEGGVFTNASISVSLTAPSGQIRYTTDGTAPTTNSTLHTGPITISTTTTIKARVFGAGLLPSAIAAQNFVMMDSSVANFTSNLPLMIFSTTGKGIADHPPQGDPGTFASVLAIEPFRGRSSPLGSADFVGQCEMNIRGQTSASFPKQPYRVTLQDAYRNSRDASLLGLPADSDWILNNPYSDKPFIQNFLAYELFEKMGHYSVRRRFVEVFVNTSGGKISYPRDYVGIYILLEKIKASQDRVDIAKLTPYDTTEPDISGGYMFKKDKDSAGDLNFSTDGGGGFSGQALKIHEPHPDEITDQQLNWLRNYLDQFEKALYAANWKTATGTNHYSYYIDTDSLVDFHWIVEFTKQIDGYRLSNYMQKDRNGKIKMEPIWDWNLSFGNADYNDGFNTTGWYYSIIGENDHIWLRRLIAGTTSPSGTTGDPDFNQKISDRWSVLRTNIFASSNVLARVDELAGILNEATVRDFKKWPRLGTYIWPNPSFYATPTTYAGIITSMKNWISGRYNWIDSQFLRPPTPNHYGGRVPKDFSLSLSASAGSVYYTLDGSDPRLSGGAVSPQAMLYSGPVSLSEDARLVARVKNGAKWSGPTAATFLVKSPSLIISELMYHPASRPDDGRFAAEDFEYIEFKNAGTNALSLNGFTIAEGVQFQFPNHLLQAGERVLVVKNRLAFELRYPDVSGVIGEYSGSLDNGERILILGPYGETVIDFSYSSKWQTITSGYGFSLVPRDETLLGEAMNQPENWRASARLNGSPGAQEPPSLPFPAIVISELLTHPTSSNNDLLELQNLSLIPADVGGWFLTDDIDIPKKFRIPNGTIIGPSGFLRIQSFELSSQSLIPFGFSSLGEQVFIFSGDLNTNLTGYLHGFKFGARSEGISFGRYVDSEKREHFVAQTSNTFGMTNAGPRIPEVVISEIMYHPPDIGLNGGFWNDSEDEYIELANRKDEAVALFDPSAPTNTWKLSGSVEYSFPANTFVPANGYLLIVSFDAAVNPTQTQAFKTKYSIGEDVTLVGPYSGNLGNDNGKVSLLFPDITIQDGATNGTTETTTPYVLAEEIEYSDNSPWPSGADGFGFSLTRLDLSAFGDDPATWIAARPSPGRSLPPISDLAIAQQPAAATVISGHETGLRVIASGGDFLRYQWRLNGANISGATNASLDIVNAQPQHAGTYEVNVMDSTASLSSDPVQVTVVLDTDGDGIPDNWELAFDLNPFDAGDANADTDGDGMSNYDEFIAGTDPRDPRSFLGIQQVSVADQAQISFQAMADHSYSVQFSDSLFPPVWTNLSNVKAQNTNFTATVLDATVGAARFYRIVTPSKP